MSEEAKRTPSDKANPLGVMEIVMYFSWDDYTLPDGCSRKVTNGYLMLLCNSHNDIMLRANNADLFVHIERAAFLHNEVVAAWSGSINCFLRSDIFPSRM